LQEKIIPAFERVHGPGFQALFVIDNSQGHAAYAENALLVSRMNLRPGGKQARLRNGWFIRDGIKVHQPMIFPPYRNKIRHDRLKRRWCRPRRSAARVRKDWIVVPRQGCYALSRQRLLSKPM
jgi:hypothetical protein